ncbi:cytochrome c biogenesis protein CcdA [Gemmatimonas sp.]|jgi:thiol:disulfide interchange protein DsbD|uniref:cytochrome c biogenesis protein CcdA n=1 Tax=Gemmatimonas sp. TaxID=1962908 RepID=UPI0037BFCC2E
MRLQAGRELDYELLLAFFDLIDRAKQRRGSTDEAAASGNAIPWRAVLWAMALLQIADVTAQLSGSPAAALPLLFGAGVLTSLTPCVYPMIPITAAIVGGQSSSEQLGVTTASKWRPLGLSMVYVVGLASVYAGLGLLAGLTGTMFGTVSANPWAYFTMANLLLIAGLSMLDVIPVRVPAALMQRAANAGTGGRVAGAFIMGAASGLVAAPCSAPVMAAVLTWVSTTRSALLGFTYLFTFSLGMCTLLVLVGISAGTLSRLPRAGAWMLTVKKLFAFVMIAMAEYYLVKMGQVYF